MLKEERHTHLFSVHFIIYHIHQQITHCTWPLSSGRREIWIQKWNLCIPSTYHQNWSLLSRSIQPDEIQNLKWVLNYTCILQVNSQLIGMHDGSTTHEPQLTGLPQLLTYINQFFLWLFTSQIISKFERWPFLGRAES